VSCWTRRRTSSTHVIKLANDTLWDRPTVGHHGHERKTINHPQFGELELDCDVLSVHGMDLCIIVFTADPNSAAAGKLRLLTVLGTEEMAPPRSIDVPSATLGAGRCGAHGVLCPGDASRSRRYFSPVARLLTARRMSGSRMSRIETVRA